MAKRNTAPKRGRYGRGRPKTFGARIPRGARRFRLPTTGQTLYVTGEKYPRLFQWIQNADLEDE